MNVLSKIEPLLLQAQKPAQYIGGEMGSVIKKREDVDVRFAFCFPDTYEIGMSHLGMKILYSLINARENFWCERVFAPCADFEALMRQNEIPLYALESLDAVRDFDFVGFTLQYELSFTNILNMLDLAGIPLHARDRGETLAPLVVAGGPCVCNPEPLADFFDLFILGEGEEVNLELMDLELSEPLPCETVMERLNAVLPEGIRILEAGKGQLAFKKLAYARYTVRIPCEDAAVLHRSFDSFCAQPEIITEKRTKKGGTKEVDLKPMLEVTAVTEQPDALEVELCLPAGSIANLNPMLLLDAWKKQSGAALSAPEISRTELLTEEKQKFF